MKNQDPQIESQSLEKKPIANKEQKEKFLEYFRQLPIQALGAEFIGVDETTISRWKKDDSVFANQVASAKSAWALDNARRVRSKEWLLERVMSNHFMEKKSVEVSGDPLIIIKETNGSKSKPLAD